MKTMNPLKKIKRFNLTPLVTPLQAIEHNVFHTVFIFTVDALALCNHLFGQYPAMDIRTFSSISIVNTSHFEGNPITLNDLNDGVGIGSLDGVINRLCKQGKLKEAVDMLHIYDQRGIRVSFDMYGFLFQHCAKINALLEGKRVHVHMNHSGQKPSAFVSNHLVNMYARCGNLQDARHVFDKMPERNVFSWNTMISGYVKCGRLDSARDLFEKMRKRDTVTWNTMIVGFVQHNRYSEVFELFYQMQREGIAMSHFSVTSVLSACARSLALEQGKQIHGHTIKAGFLSHLYVSSALVDTYAKCGRIEDARQVFDKMLTRDVLSWTAMISGYTKCGNVEFGRDLFDKMPERNMVSWTAMIGGYSQQGNGEKALELFYEMQVQDMKPDQFTFGSVLKACAGLASPKQGKKVHAQLIRAGLESNVFVASALVDMYAKCGIIEDARHAFDKIPKLDVVAWNAMIAGYAQHGCGKDAVKLFEEMLQVGMKPDDVTFIVVLSACSHGGLVDEGRKYFDSMAQEHCITPKEDHYACLIDLLGRAGHLDEAMDCITNMPFKPNANVWNALLGACRLHGNVELGIRAAEPLLELEPQASATYILLSNIYAAVGRWDDAARVRKLMKDRGVKKEPGLSWIEVKSKMHKFIAEDRSHPQTEDIYAMLESLYEQMKTAGYVVNTDLVLHNVEQEQKQQSLSHHSEKLAIAFGLISTTPGTPLLIIKNLRVCGDCHTAIKLISKIVNREIFLRDISRFHHFKNGLCSCGDYW